MQCECPRNHIQGAICFREQLCPNDITRDGFQEKKHKRAREMNPIVCLVKRVKSLQGGKREKKKGWDK